MNECKKCEELLETLHDVFHQACYNEKTEKYDHEFTSAYEEAQYVLLDAGKIKPRQCYRN